MFVSGKWSRCLQCSTIRKAGSALSEWQDDLFNIIRSQRTFVEAKSIGLICFTLLEAINSCSFYPSWKLFQKKTKEFCTQKLPCFSSQNAKIFCCACCHGMPPSRDLSRVAGWQWEQRRWQCPGAGLALPGQLQRGSQLLPCPQQHCWSTGRAGQGEQAASESRHGEKASTVLYKQVGFSSTAPGNNNRRKQKTLLGTAQSQTSKTLSALHWTCTVVTQNTSFHNTGTLICILNTKLTIPPSLFLAPLSGIWEYILTGQLKDLPLLDFMLFYWWRKWAEGTNM